MPFVENVKRAVGIVTGYGRPSSQEALRLVRSRKPQAFHFDDDGETPNNPDLASVWYRTPVRLGDEYDPAAIFEVLFATHGWGSSWRNGIFPYLHFHTGTHEVLGIARGHARVQLGGNHGRRLTLRAGDVVILPAGTGHRSLGHSDDLLVVGAYPESGEYDEARPRDVDHAEAVAAIGRVPSPARDPVYGAKGPLLSLWRHRTRQSAR